MKKKGKAFPATHHFILAMPKPSSELAQIVFVCPKSMKYSGKTREGQIQGIYSELPVLHLKMAQFFSMISSTVWGTALLGNSYLDHPTFNDTEISQQHCVYKWNRNWAMC